MTAQGERRDRCRVLPANAMGDRHQPWCVTHDLPAGHATPQPGDVHADPADRPLPSDAEEQFTGRPTGGGDTGARAARTRTAVAQLRSPSPADHLAGSAALQRLRAEHAAEAAIGNTAAVLLVAAYCARCGEQVARSVLDLADQPDAVLLTAWVHELRATEADHPVTTVRVQGAG